MITTLDDLLGLFDLSLWSEQVHRVCPAVQGQHSLAGKLLQALGLTRCRGLVYNLQCWDDLHTPTGAGLAVEYQSLFPCSFSTLTRETLSSNLTPQVATKRSVAKKRGFSEAALAATIPGDFVSASALQAEITADQKVSYAPIKQTKDVLALYVVIAVDEARQTTAVGCLCRSQVAVAGGVLDALSVVPKLLHLRQLKTSSAGFSLDLFINESRTWANSLVRAPVPPSTFGFTAAPLLTKGSPAIPMKADLLRHADGGLSALFADNSDQSLHVVGLGAGVNVLADSSSSRPVINSLSGHINEAVDLNNLTALSGNGASLSSIQLSFLLGAEPDTMEIFCQHATLRFPDAASSPTAYAPATIFATQFAKSLFAQWALPAPINGGMKTEILKRIKLLRDVWFVLQVMTRPSSGGPSASEDAMDVDGNNGDAAAATAVTQLRPLHFAIAPKTSTSNASGCSAQMVFALHRERESVLPHGANKAKNAAMESCGAYLVVSFSYSTSTMRGMGKSISTAEISEMTFRDMAGDSFTRSHSMQELAADNGALLLAVQKDYFDIYNK